MAAMSTIEVRTPEGVRSYCDLQTVREYLPVCAMTVWRWARDGKVPAVQPGGKGGKWYFDLEYIQSMAAVAR